VKEAIEQFKSGDPIEVRFATHDGYIWNRAEVLYVDHKFIAVAYPSGTGQALPHNEGRYRAPQIDIFCPTTCENRNTC
jgi:hypothetical protein